MPGLDKRYECISHLLHAVRNANQQPSRYKSTSTKLIFFTILLVCSQQLVAQDSSGTKQEVWPEVNLFYKLNNKFRIYGLYSATKLRNSSYTDGGFGIYLDYFTLARGREKLGFNTRDSTAGYYLWLRAGYLYSSTPPESEDPFKENTLVTEANVRFHLPYEILLTNKNRFDWRSINGSFEPRYRPRLTIEKDMRTEYLYFTPSIYGEYYVYFHGGGLNRFRISASIQIKVTAHIEFETYYVHQFDNGKNVDALDAMGLALKFYFKHKEVKQKFSKKNKAK
jgi:hypothetical protein